MTWEEGGDAEFLRLLQIVVPKLFRLWPISTKQKDLVEGEAKMAA